MAIGAMALVILPGKLEAWREYNSQVNGPRRAEFEDMLRRYGFTKWMVWRQQTPMADLLISYQETTGEVGGMMSIATSKHQFDLWFKAQVKEFTGLDLNQPPPGRPPELVLQYPR
jgi:hypothetical protein